MMVSNGKFDVEYISTPGHTVSRRQNPLWVDQRTAAKLVAPTYKKICLLMDIFNKS